MNNKLSLNREKKQVSELAKVYIVALGLIIGSTILSQLYVQNFLKKQSDDSRLINIAGRQRMLSQKITKQMLIIISLKNKKEILREKQELQNTLDLWKKSHKALIFGDKTIGISKPRQSEAIKDMFHLINPHYKSILQSTNLLLKQDSKINKARGVSIKNQILKHEKDFLQIMDNITFQYDKEANIKLDNLKNIELSLMLVTLGLLIIEALLIFRPAIKRIKKHITEIKEKRLKLEKSNTDLTNTQKELKEYIDELQATEEELRQNIEELEATKEELYQQNEVLEEQKLLLLSSQKLAKTASYEQNLIEDTIRYSEDLPTLYGLERDKTINRDTLNKIIHEEDLEYFNKEIENILRKKKTNISITYRAKGETFDKWHYYKILGNTIYDNDNQPFKLIGAIQDITEYVNSKKELRKSYDNLKSSKKALKKSFESLEKVKADLEKEQIALQKTNSLLESINATVRIGIWEIDLINRTMNVDKITRELHEVGENFEYATHKFLQFYDNSSRITLFSAFDKIMKKHQKFDMEYQITTAQGNKKWLKTIGIPFIQDGTCTKIYGLLQDIDERKTKELEIQKLSLVASKINTGVVITDEKGYTTWVNEGFTNISGYDLEDIIGRKPGDILQGEDTNPKDIQVIRNGLVNLKPFKHEILNYTKDKKPYWIEIIITPIFSDEGLQFIAIENDITKRKVQEQILEQKNIELENYHEDLLEINKQLSEASKQITSMNNRLISSLRSAHTMQQAILPSYEKLDNLLHNYFIIYRPKDIVSGDFYWIYEVNNHVILITADCTGHGVRGAFMTLIGNNLLNIIVRSLDFINPSQILTLLNKEIQTLLRQEQTDDISGMDAVVVVLKKKKEYTEVNFSGAKNNLLYFNSEESEIKELRGVRKSIGGIQNQNRDFESLEITLPRGSKLYLGSDGLEDQNDVRRKKFGTKRLKEVLENNVNLSLSKQKEILETELNNHMKGTEQRDDILWMGVEV